MITWMRDASGSFSRLDGVPEDARAREVFIEVLDPEARQWRDDYRARFPRGKAIELVEHAIAKKQVRFSGYRLTPAPAKPISEATRARLAALHARQEAAMPKKGKKERGVKTPTAPPTSAPELGATFVERGPADGTVRHLARLGIISEVIPDGRYFRVKVYPLPPKGTH